MIDLQIHLTTFNCGRAYVHRDYFASSLYSSLNKPGQLPPDLLVLTLQEIAPIGAAFLGGSLLAPYFAKVIEAVEKATRNGVEHVISRNAGMTGILVFAKKEVKDRIRWIEEGGTGVGLWEMGNKGAVGIRLGLEGEDEDDTAITFVAAHLAPMEDAVERRNEDWRNICETLVFEPVQGRALAGSEESEPLLSSAESSTPPSQRTKQPNGLFTPPTHIFFAGDLNYRTSNIAPDPKDFTTWPQPMTESTDPTHYTHLLSHDQLTCQLTSNKTLHNLSEVPIAFPPTYKYSSRAQKLAEETANAHLPSSKTDEEFLKLDEIQEQVWLWAKHRMPSWCDRVLFLKEAPPKKVHQYTALPVQPTSDHRPVVFSCSIPDKAVKATVKPPFEIAKDYKERRVAARRLEFIVGLGAYLGFTGQGQTVLGGTAVGIVAGYFLLQYLVGGA